MPPYRSIALVSNALLPPADEGIKKLAQRAARHLVTAGSSVYPIQPGSSLLLNKLLLGPTFLRTLREDEASVLVYIPTQSATLGTYTRCFVLRSFTRKRVVLVATQPGRIPPGERFWARWMRPALVLTPSPGLHRRLQALGLESSFFPMGTDLPEAHRADQTERVLERYGIPTSRPLVLHVGHISESRNLQWLQRLRAELNATVVLVAGSAFPANDAVRAELVESRILILEDYIPDIMTLYRASDCYVFPVLDPNGAIGVPLSVLEALACDTPVVTTPFGGLPLMLSPQKGLVFVSDEDSFVRAVRDIIEDDSSTVATRSLVEQFSWENVIESLVDVAARVV